MVLVVAFALDGVVFLRAACPRDEVDAGVLRRDAELGRADFLRPIREEPHVRIEVRIAGLKAEVGADEFLEVAALFALGLGGGAVFGEDLLEGEAGIRSGWREQPRGKAPEREPAGCGGERNALACRHA